MSAQNKIHKVLIIGITYTTIAMLGIYITLYQYTILSVSQLFSADAAMMGLMIGMQHFGISIPPLFLGTLSGRIGKKNILMISILLITIGTFLVGLTNSFGAFVGSIFIVGAGFSVTEGTMSAVLTDEYPKETTKHLNFSQVAFSGGAFAGPLIAEGLIDSGVYFKDLYFYVSAVFLVLGVIFYFTKQQNDKGETSVEAANFNVIRFLRNKVFLLLALGIFLYVGIENTIAYFSDSYYELILGKPHLSALALSLFWGAMIPSRFLAGIIKVNLKKMFVVLSSLIFAGTIAAMLIPNITVKIILFAVCGFGCGPLWPLMMDMVAKKNRGAAGPALNVMMTFTGLGGATLPFISGIFVNFSNQQTAYYICAVAAVLMAIMYVSSLKKTDVSAKSDPT